MPDITLTSKIGKFTFDEDTSLSIAKLVRDTVTGQWLSPKDREPELYCIEDAYTFIGQHQSDIVNRVQFELELHEAYAVASAMYKARKATSHFGDAFRNIGVVTRELEVQLIGLVS